MLRLHSKEALMQTELGKQVSEHASLPLTLRTDALTLPRSDQELLSSSWTRDEGLRRCEVRRVEAAHRTDSTNAAETECPERTTGHTE